MALTGITDVSRLRRSWWSTPAWMTAWLLVPAILVAPGAGPGPIFFALGLGGCGLLYGCRSSAKAKEQVTKQFSVTYLNDAHPIAQRVHRLATQLELPNPAVGLMQTANAFAVGTNAQSSAVVLGLPLIKILADDELEAVIGHELGHIATNDMQRMQIATGYQSLFGGMGGGLSLALSVSARASRKHRGELQLALVIVALARLALLVGSELALKRLSRKREFYADAIGAALTSPDAMSRALDKIHGLASEASAPEQKYACLMFRAGSKRGSWFATHPLLEDRQEALASGKYLEKLGSPSQAQQLWDRAAPVMDIGAQIVQKQAAFVGAQMSEHAKTLEQGILKQVTAPHRRQQVRRKPISTKWLVTIAFLFGFPLGVWGMLEAISRCWVPGMSCELNAKRNR